MGWHNVKHVESRKGFSGRRTPPRQVGVKNKTTSTGRARGEVGCGVWGPQSPSHLAHLAPLAEVCMLFFTARLAHLPPDRVFQRLTETEVRRIGEVHKQRSRGGGGREEVDTLPCTSTTSSSHFGFRESLVYDPYPLIVHFS